MNPPAVSWLETGWLLTLTQLGQLTFLICIVLVLTRLLGTNRPHLCHALWGLVLLKCIVPPVLASPASPFIWVSNGVLTKTSREPATQVEPRSSRFHSTFKIQARDEDKSTPANGPLETAGTPRSSTDISLDSPQTKLVQPNRSTTYKSTGSHSSDAFGWQNLLILLFAGSTVYLMISISRLLTFLRRVQEHRVVGQASTRRIFNETRSTLLRKNHTLWRPSFTQHVRLEVIDCLIGPAVVGLCRPRILLPKVLERGCSQDELRMLIAHELIHIRRGDLWWSAIQTLARCLWWFHPLVSLASNRFERATELSCDEETVASLRCSPAVYARSLLTVLERKHDFQVAPLLPGVRPVELTTKRMERIMNLTEQALPRRPWWTLVVLFAGAMFVLPGASMGNEDETDSRNAPASLSQPPVPSALTPPQTLPPPPRLPRQPQGVQPALPIFATVGGFEKADKASRIVYHSSLPTIGCIQKELDCDFNQATLALSSRLDSIAPEGCKVIVGGKITAQGPESFHKLINQELTRIQKYGISKQLTIEFQIISVEQDLFKSLPLSWDIMKSDVGRAPVVTCLLQPKQYEQISEEIQHAPGTKILHNPKLRVFNGQSVTIADLTERPFITRPSYAKVEKDGLECQVVSSIQENHIELKIKFERSTIRDVRQFSYQNLGEELTLQVPDVRKEQAEIAINVPKEIHLAFAMPSADDDKQVSLYIITPREFQMPSEALDSQAITPAKRKTPLDFPALPPANNQGTPE
ncbi:M56 family metallopeptidase [Planctomycetaceae bacterium SH139]